MGVSHDNDHPACADGLHIMSGEWIKGQNPGDVSWSTCSREDVEKFLRLFLCFFFITVAKKMFRKVIQNV